mgnify:CR=1 FL=1
MVPLADPAFPDNCLTRNEWICGRYYSTRSHELESALLQHLGIVLASVALGLVLAIPLALLARRYRKLEGIIVGSTTAEYVERAKSAELEAVVASFDDMLGKTIKRLVEWTLKTGTEAEVQRRPANAPRS